MAAVQETSSAEAHVIKVSQEGGGGDTTLTQTPGLLSTPATASNLTNQDSV